MVFSLSRFILGIVTDLFRFMFEENLATMGITDVKPNGVVPRGRFVDEEGTLKRPDQGEPHPCGLLQVASLRDWARLL